jgi:hypothetical protein
VQSSVCADINIWSGNKKERSCWRDGRGIGEVGKKIGKKIDEKMGKKMGGKRRDSGLYRTKAYGPNSLGFLLRSRN